MPGSTTFVDIIEAAKIAGFSIRHFRRLLENSGVKIYEFGSRSKFFIKREDIRRVASFKV